jgi:hypothetical protein
VKYPKINSLWKRDEKNKFNIIEGDYSCEEFNNIINWIATEKIDGTNIRIRFDRGLDLEPKFFGRTDEAEIPGFLLHYLTITFTREMFIKQFPNSQVIHLYGEGYGNKIQDIGKLYRSDNSFILFDAFIDGWWLDFYKVQKLASDLKIECVPSLGILKEKEIINKVKIGFGSGINPIVNAEGIVAKSYPLMLFKDRTPIMFKLKHKDYLRLKS